MYGGHEGASVKVADRASLSTRRIAASDTGGGAAPHAPSGAASTSGGTPSATPIAA
jgi:hypothetical protein